MSSREIVPLKSRPADWPILFFFFLNILFITYMVDIEQLTVADPANFQYPLWPPRFMVELVHWYGYHFDPVLIARPAWWKVTIWIDAVFFGPFYIVGIYAFIRGREWIRVPSFIWASVLITNVLVILGEEFYGSHATPSPVLVLFLNLPWLVCPAYVIGRMWLRPHPFTRGPQEGS